jgi:hypothetical protein
VAFRTLRALGDEELCRFAYENCLKVPARF